ncbi:MAG: exosortase-associated EpsI family protein [Opitutae bacterium]|nr:exosortase-associated EpsI family protein [Opitutae bacterium]
MKRVCRTTYWGLGVGAVVLCAAFAFQFLRIRDLSAGDVGTARAVGHLKGKIPEEIEGWRSREEPLGTTEVVKGQVEAILNFDDYVFRVFTRGTTHLGVYVAYWKRDRMPVSRVASHTPDRCWSENGWTCESMNFNEVWSTGSAKLQPTQRRVFVSPVNGREDVAFWHLVNGRAFDFGERFTLFTHPGKWIRDTASYAALGSGEQYFVRLTSNRPFEEFKGDPGWVKLLGALARLGLAEPPSASNQVGQGQP